jgi:hypothetical protein
MKYHDAHDRIMNFRLLSALIVLLLAFSFGAACTGAGSDVGPSPTETTPIETPGSTATPVSTSTVSLTPGPTQTMPPGKEVEFQITGGFPSRVTNDLYIAFRGGAGKTFVKSIDVRVTKSTGEVVTDSLQPITGEELIIQNAKGENRVEITISLITGGSYKVIDQIAVVP